jgi:prepilin-type N-terminal cleavage/methylation domain-containing protein
MKHSSAFTLVELIVVITILAILSTIAFLSFSGYSASARDSVRMEDMKNLQQGLTLNMAKAGSISYPSNAKQVFLSGSLFLYQ